MGICKKNQVTYRRESGKGVSKKSNVEKLVYHLNAMYEGGTVGVEIKQVIKKENDIFCLPDYLKLFELSDTIVTMDAVCCNQSSKQSRKAAGTMSCK